jgi:hypothetical protein
MENNLVKVTFDSGKTAFISLQSAFLFTRGVPPVSAWIAPQGCCTEPQRKLNLEILEVKCPMAPQPFTQEEMQTFDLFIKCSALGWKWRTRKGRYIPDTSLIASDKITDTILSDSECTSEYPSAPLDGAPVLPTYTEVPSLGEPKFYDAYPAPCAARVWTGATALLRPKHRLKTPSIDYFPSPLLREKKHACTVGSFCLITEHGAGKELSQWLADQNKDTHTLVEKECKRVKEGSRSFPFSYKIKPLECASGPRFSVDTDKFSAPLATGSFCPYIHKADLSAPDSGKVVTPVTFSAGHAQYFCHTWAPSDSTAREKADIDSRKGTCSVHCPCKDSTCPSLKPKSVPTSCFTRLSRRDLEGAPANTWKLAVEMGLHIPIPTNETRVLGFFDKLLGDAARKWLPSGDYPYGRDNATLSLIEGTWYLVKKWWDGEKARGLKLSLMTESANPDFTIAAKALCDQRRKKESPEQGEMKSLMTRALTHCIKQERDAQKKAVESKNERLQKQWVQWIIRTHACHMLGGTHALGLADDCRDFRSYTYADEPSAAEIGVSRDYERKIEDAALWEEMRNLWQEAVNLRPVPAWQAGDDYTPETVKKYVKPKETPLSQWLTVMLRDIKAKRYSLREKIWRDGGTKKKFWFKTKA